MLYRHAFVFLLAALCPVTPLICRAADYMIGADLSFLAQAETSGTVFKDNGQPKPALQIFKDHGYNWIRLRLFNDPAAASTRAAPVRQNLPNDLPYTLSLAKDAKQHGFKLLLDFHYSDTWADPGKQFIPTAWQGKSHAELVTALHDYTRDTIAALRTAGAMPDMVQIGNEVTNGMLWPDAKLSGANSTPDGWPHFIDLLKAGISGIHDGRADAPRQKSCSTSTAAATKKPPNSSSTKSSPLKSTSTSSANPITPGTTARCSTSAKISSSWPTLTKKIS